MTFDPDTIKLPQGFHERMDRAQWNPRQKEIFAARQGAAQAVEALRHQWPEWITREPTAEDADEDGWVQTLHEGRIDLTDFRHTNGQPWLHVPGWRPKPEPTPKQQALVLLNEPGVCDLGAMLLGKSFTDDQIALLRQVVESAPDTTP